MGTRPPARIRLSRVIGGLSYALDLTEGEPPGHAVRSCVIGMRIADALGLDAATRSLLFYALLMKDAGCSANAARMAALFGADDHEAKRTVKRSTGRAGSPHSVGRCATSRPDDSFRAAAARPAGDQGRGRGHAFADARPLRPRRRDRAAARAALRHRGGDPRARRALGRQRPAVRPARRGDPAARAHRLPRADGGDVPRRGRARRRVRGRGAPQRRVVRPRPRRRPARCRHDDGVLGGARHAPTSPRGNRRTGC